MSETKKSSSESVPGNVYDKYGTRNPISRALMRGFDRRMMELLKHVGQPDSILEVGCGEGELIKKLANIFPSARLLGLDVSRDVIDEAKRRHVGLDFKVMSIYQLTEQFEKFDLVVASEVLEHLEDPQAGLRALTYVTKRHIFVSVPREPIWSLLNCCRGKYLNHLGNTPGHTQHWRASNFVLFLESIVDVLALRKPLPWTQALCRRRA